jgi:hypothetical protein
MQYVRCTFRREGGTGYTYHNTGAPVKVGDEVKVANKDGEGWRRVFVTEVDVAKPTKFDTKPILGIAPPEE